MQEDVNTYLKHGIVTLQELDETGYDATGDYTLDRWFFSLEKSLRNLVAASS